MANKTYKMLRNRQKMHIKVYAVICVVLFLSVGFYSFQKWTQYSLARAGVAANEELIEALTNKFSEEKAEYFTKKDEFKALSEEISERLEDIFPTDDDYTNLTRQFDSYEVELSKKNDPFEISHIDYQAVQENEYYSVLPLRLNIRSSQENFTKFLHLVENSGGLQNPVRLMDISSIRLNFGSPTQESETGPEIITFTIQINAYFQKK